VLLGNCVASRLQACKISCRPKPRLLSTEHFWDETTISFDCNKPLLHLLEFTPHETPGKKRCLVLETTARGTCRRHCRSSTPAREASSLPISVPLSLRTDENGLADQHSQDSPPPHTCGGNGKHELPLIKTKAPQRCMNVFPAQSCSIQCHRTVAPRR